MEGGGGVVRGSNRVNLGFVEHTEIVVEDIGSKLMILWFQISVYDLIS